MTIFESLLRSLPHRFLLSRLPTGPWGQQKSPYGQAEAGNRTKVGGSRQGRASWPLCSQKMSAISMPFPGKPGPGSCSSRGVAVVSNGLAMALPWACTSCPKDELGANESGE